MQLNMLDSEPKQAKLITHNFQKFSCTGHVALTSAAVISSLRYSMNGVENKHLKHEI